MKKTIGIIAMLFMMTSVGECLAKNEKQNFDLNYGLIVEQIQDGIAAAQIDLIEEDMPTLKSVKLVLSTVRSKSVNGGFKFLIFSFGKKWEKSKTQTVTLEFTPAEPETSLTSDNKIAELLKDAIVDAVKSTSKIANHKAVPLEVSKMSFDLDFVVKDSGGGKFSIEPLSIELGGDISDSEKQKMTIVFGK